MVEPLAAKEYFPQELVEIKTEPKEVEYWANIPGGQKHDSK